MDYKDFKTVVSLVVSKFMEDEKRNYITLEDFTNELKDKANQLGMDIEFLDKEKYGYQQALEMCRVYTTLGSGICPVCLFICTPKKKTRLLKSIGQINRKEI